MGGSDMRRLSLFLVWILILTAVPSVMGQEEEVLPPACVQLTGVLDQTPRFGVLSAFAPESVMLLEAMDVENVYNISGKMFYTGILEGDNIVFAETGVSMHNAYITALLMVTHFNLDRAIMSGIAGGVAEDLHVGTVTVPSQWAPYLGNVRMLREGADGSFEVPEGDMQNFGMILPRELSVFDCGNPTGYRQMWFPADEDMLEVMQSIASDVESEALSLLNDCTDDNVCLTHPPRLVVGGNGISAGAFVDNAAFRLWVQDAFGAVVLEMETAAVAMIMWIYEIPFVATRSLSDLAGGGEGQNEIQTFFVLAANNSAAVTIEFMRRWDDSTTRAN